MAMKNQNQIDQRFSAYGNRVPTSHSAAHKNDRPIRMSNDKYGLKHKIALHPLVRVPVKNDYISILLDCFFSKNSI